MLHFIPTPAEGATELIRTEHSSAETVVLAPQENEGGPDFYIPDSDRWIYVLAGTGRAVVGEEAIDLEPGVVLLVEAGETHELTNNGSSSLETLCIYAPTRHR